MPKQGIELRSIKETTEREKGKITGVKYVCFQVAESFDKKIFASN